jgi:hypothetical protein
MSALERANEIRRKRVEIREALRAGELGFADALAADANATAVALDVVQLAPRVGPVQAMRILRCANVSATRRCGDLTARQRAVIASELGR